MPSTTTTELIDCAAYECDAPTCRNTCKSYHASSCGWVPAEVPEFPVHLRERARRWFCSWKCMADWARYMQGAYPLKTRQPAAVPRELPF